MDDEEANLVSAHSTSPNEKWAGSISPFPFLVLGTIKLQGSQNQGLLWTFSIRFFKGWQARQRRAGKPSKWHEPNYKEVTYKHLVSAHLISDQTLRHHGTNKIDGEKNKSDSRLMPKSFHLFFCIKCRQNPPKTPDQARRLSQVMGPSSSIHWHKCRANTLK